MLNRIRDALLCVVGLAAGYCPLPVAVVIDSQTVSAAETVARSSRGYDAPEKANSRKRSVAVDFGGMLLTAFVTGTGIQDCDIARELLAGLRAEHAVVSTTICADGAYRGALVPWAAELLRFRIEIVSRPAGTRGFIALLRVAWNLVVGKMISRRSDHD